jgi:molybdopterin converting factor small subunit
MATIIIPTPLRKFTDNKAKVNISDNKVSGIFMQLTNTFPELKKHLIDSDGNVASFISVFVDNEDIRNLEEDEMQISDKTVISIIPAIAGGSDFPKSYKKRLKL